MSRAAVPAALAGIAAVTLAGAYAMAAYAPAQPPRVNAMWGRTGGRATDAVEVTGLPASVLHLIRGRATDDARWDAVLRVVVDQPQSTPAAADRAAVRLPRVIGRYVVRDDRIRFEPRFPFVPGVPYRVEFDPAALDDMAGRALATSRAVVLHRFRIPAVVGPRTTRVTAVHPSAEHLPSNMLRWYVEFSAPMEPGAAHEHVRLLDEAGRPVDGAFLRVDEELWDRDRRRLTLLFDPGRVKQGVRTNLELGAPLAPGHRYRLVIEPAWPDATGAPLASGFDREIEAGPADAESPDPGRWRLLPPRTGTRGPLRVAFGEPLDHALALRMITLKDARGSTIAGRVELDAGDSAWTFVPSSAWSPGNYGLRVDARLEDLAGNSVARTFDADRRGGAPAVEETAGRGPSRVVTFTLPSGS